jgi:hypothetical protein
MYMELPKGVEMKDGNRKMHVLKLLKNLYGQKLDESGINILLKVYVNSVFYNLRLMSVCFIAIEPSSWYMSMMEYLLVQT